MNRSLSDPITASLVEQLVFFDEQKTSLLERHFPEHHRDRRGMELLINRYRERLEAIVAENNRDVLSQTVLIGSNVTVRSDEDGTVESYTIVMPEAANIEECCISFLSPLGQELLLSEKGQIITVQTPAGSYELTVVDITSGLPA
ncbi:Transcription elongation factor GreA [Paenibacillus plantiphilus]|uniref:Transcription elongation factor GreA n=1 Tax=Paenibacillus plantiphilus TaxID=2905650 RepID=A0ABN8GJU3_9BACL|nr:GreA/GreB family elongation factor [Paenibacillus plantiphilus]CAH1210739.1 Transcription elongation factor GreA [Paenibacillus plantiphilus]